MHTKVKNKIYLSTKIIAYILGAYFLLKMMGFLQSLFIGLMVAAGTAWIQHRGWENQEKIKAFDNEKKKAYELIEQISQVVGKRIYHQELLIQALRYKDNSYCRESYKSSVKEMNEKFYTICVGLKYSFDAESMLIYENSFQNRLAKNNNFILNTAKDSSQLLEIDSASRELKQISWELNKFTNNLLKKTRDNEFANFTRKKPKINLENKDKLSVTYLVFRLFNIRQ